MPAGGVLAGLCYMLRRPAGERLALSPSCPYTLGDDFCFSSTPLALFIIPYLEITIVDNDYKSPSLLGIPKNLSESGFSLFRLILPYFFQYPTYQSKFWFQR